MNINDYQKSLQEQVARAARPDRSADAVRTLQDKSGDPAARISALTDALDAPGEFGALASEAIATLVDGAEDEALRVAALETLLALEFQGPRFDAHRADFEAALKSVMADEVEAVRERALEALAMRKDPDVTERLIAGLKDPSAALVPPVKAIEYLAYDEHSGVAKTVRALFDTLDETAREQAVRVLSTDPDAADLLQQVMEDREARSSLRRLSAAGLRHVAPETFATRARAMIAETSDYPEIRATLLTALTTLAKAEDRALAQRAEETAGDEAAVLRSAAKRFLSKVPR